MCANSRTSFNALVMAESLVIRPADLPAAISGVLDRGSKAQTGAGYDAEVRDFKRRLITRTLRVYEGNKSAAARSLHLARPYLHRLIEDLQVGGCAAKHDRKSA